MVQSHYHFLLLSHPPLNLMTILLFIERVKYFQEFGEMSDYQEKEEVTTRQVS